MTKIANQGIPKNYQKLHYEEYHIMLSDGSTIRTTRRECFTEGPAPEGCPYKQRWYYSPDQFMAIRLPRNELGEKIGKDNAADLKAQERVAERIRKHGYVELDAPINDEGDTLEIADPNPNAEEAYIQKETIAAIYAAVDELPADLKDLWVALLAGEKQCDIAARYGVSATAIRKRTEKLGRVLAANPKLKNIFEKFSNSGSVFRFACPVQGEGRKTLSQKTGGKTYESNVKAGFIAHGSRKPRKGTALLHERYSRLLLEHRE